MFYKLFITLIISLTLPMGAYAIDLGNESTADKADHFDFEEFHEEKGITIWEGKKEKTATTYEESNTGGKPAASAAAPTGQKSFEKGQELKVREAYKLGSDPALRNIQSLYDATEALHKQLHGLCPNGWAKDSEWHKPEQNYFYIHYSALCL